MTHVRGPLFEEDHYYPFGLLMTGISDKALKANYAENKYRFNGGVELQNKEFSDGSGLEEYATTFRMYDPQIGRFGQIDPLADISENYSPYSFANDNPILLNDPFGADTTCPGCMQEVIVTPPPTPPLSQVNVGLADTKGDDPGVSAGDAPATVDAPIKTDNDEQNEALTKVTGWDHNDPISQLDHTIVEQPTWWQGFINGPMYQGKNALGDKVYRPYYGGTAPAEGSFNRAEGIAELFRLRSARSWEELFEWGHNTDIIVKLSAVSASDVARLKSAGVTLEQMQTWGKFYESAIFKSANASNLTAKYRLDYINKLIQLW